MRRLRKALPHEFELIAKAFAPLATSKGALGLKDDAALLRVAEGCELVLAADALIEGIHFLPDDPAATVAQKALRTNLSDLAAKGADPLFYLLTLALPAHTSRSWIASFSAGLRSDQRRFGVSLLGGDNTRTNGPRTVAITAIGSVPRGKATQRCGARQGDLVFVSGTIGDAGLGLELLKKGEIAPVTPIARYRLPDPRVALGRALRGIASAAIDVSDGLLADLGHIADVSRVRIVVEGARLPISAAVRRAWGKTSIVRAASAGDDYEIAFTARPGRATATSRPSRSSARTKVPGSPRLPGRRPPFRRRSAVRRTVPG